MLIMASHASQDATVVGRRLRRRVLLALCLSGLLPVLVLAYAVLRYLFADVGSLQGVNLIGLQGLVFFTLLAMVGAPGSSGTSAGPSAAWGSCCRRSRTPRRSAPGPTRSVRS